MIINPSKKEQAQLAAAQAALTASWAKACASVGVPTDSKFVVFEASTPESIEHNRLMGEYFKLRNRIARNIARRERHAAMKDLGLNRVRGALGGVYYE
jgi:hypothetical protein